MTKAKRPRVMGSSMNVGNEITNTMFINGAPKTAIANRARELVGEESAQKALKAMSKAKKTKQPTTKKSVVKTTKQEQKAKIENSKVPVIGPIGSKTRHSNLNPESGSINTFWIEDAPKNTNIRVAKKLAGNENMAKALKSMNQSSKKK